MTIPSSRSLIFEVKSTGERARLRQTSDVFGLLRKTSDFFRNLRKWPCRLQKSQHSQDENLTLISQKKLAGILLPYCDQLIALDVKWNTKWTTYLKRCTSSKTFCSAVRVADVKHSNSTTRKRRLFSGQTPKRVRFPKAHGLMFHFPAILTILGYAHVTHRYVTRHILISKKNLANYKILSSHTFFFFYKANFFFLQYKWAESCTANIEFSRISSAQTWHGQCIYIYKTVFAIFKKIAFIRKLLGLNTPLFNFHFWGFLKRLKFDLIVKKALRQNTSIKNSYVNWRNAVHCIAFFTISFRFHSFRRLPLDIKLKGKKLSFIL